MSRARAGLRSGTSRLTRLVGLLAAALAPACDDARAGGAADLAAAPSDLAAGADLPRGYPPGPYGAAVGDTLPDFTLPGYFSTATTGLASSQPFGDVRMDAVRTSGSRFALLLLASFF